MCLNMLFLLSPHLCFFVDFTCDLFVVRNDPWMCMKTSTQTEQMYVSTTVEAEGECWDPVS